MTPREFSTLARRVMSHPAAPYHEDGVRSEIERICAEERLEWVRDRFGNLLVRVASSARLRPLVLTAHMDHPGFEILRRLGPRRWRARFLGGVPREFFRKGVPLRLMPDGTPATLDSALGRGRACEILTRETGAATPKFAVWELPDIRLRRDRIVGRACDDLIGVACALATLIDLRRSRAAVHVAAVFSRAEEVGFQGALAVAATSQLPKDSLVISLEASRELPPVKMGRGVIIRVGDRASTFGSAATRFLVEVAGDLQKQSGGEFGFQRALMSGGTCEATAYQEYGFETAAVCVALGNYHNCGPHRTIAAEEVSRADTRGMVTLLTAAARRMSRYGEFTARLNGRLSGLLRDGRVQLLRKR